MLNMEIGESSPDNSEEATTFKENIPEETSVSLATKN